MRGDSPLTEGLLSEEVRRAGRDRIVTFIYVQKHFKSPSTFQVLVLAAKHAAASKRPTPPRKSHRTGVLPEPESRRPPAL